MSQVIQALKLSHLENELVDVHRQILKHEGVLNSPNVKSKKFREASKKKLVELLKKKEKLTSEITEAMILDQEV